MPPDVKLLKVNRGCREVVSELIKETVCGVHEPRQACLCKYLHFSLHGHLPSSQLLVTGFGDPSFLEHKLEQCLSRKNSWIPGILRTSESEISLNLLDFGAKHHCAKSI